VNFSAGPKDVFLSAAAMFGQTAVVPIAPPGDTILPPGTSMLVQGSFRVASGKQLRILAGAEFKVG